MEKKKKENIWIITPLYRHQGVQTMGWDGMLRDVRIDDGRSSIRVCFRTKSREGRNNQKTENRFRWIIEDVPRRIQRSLKG
jgi:hypothetical protein